MTHRAPLASLLTAICLVAGAAGAHAADRTATQSGNGLSVDTPCARHVTISPDPGLHGQVTITATADHAEELDRLVFETNGTARISTGHQSCWQPGVFSNFSPTLEITVRVPANFPIAVDESGAGRYAIGPVGGKLSLDLSGAAQVQADQAEALSIDLSGAGTVDVAHTSGPARIDISGHGKITIADAAIPALSLDISGAGAFSIAHGQVGTASLNDSGVGAIRLDAVVGTASVDVSGAGTVHLAKLTGALHKDVSGIGTVTVGD